jgi:hypothetical protein
MQRCREECPVGRREARLVDLALQDGELVKQPRFSTLLIILAPISRTTVVAENWQVTAHGWSFRHPQGWVIAGGSGPTV